LPLGYYVHAEPSTEGKQTEKGGNDEDIDFEQGMICYDSKAEDYLQRSYSETNKKGKGEKDKADKDISRRHT
jgi:hypothetical protein